MPIPPITVRRRYSNLRMSLNLSRDEKTRRRREIESVLTRHPSVHPSERCDSDWIALDAVLDDLLALTALGTESEAR